MTQTEMISKIHEETSFDKAVIKKVIDSFVDHLKAVVQDEGSHAINKLGIFKMVDRKERTGRNPQSGESIVIPAQKAVRFSMSKAWKDSLNGKAPDEEVK